MRLELLKGEAKPAGVWRGWPALVVGLWVIALMVCCLKSGLDVKRRSVFPIFANAGQSWLAGAELYSTGGEIYRYSPLVTLLLVPFGVLPYHVGVVLWQLFNAAVLLAALAYWRRVMLPSYLSANQLATFFLLILPLTLSNINNGQSNCLLLGLMIFAVAAVVDRRWTVAAGALVLAVFLKLYPLALLLLLVGLCPRRLGWRCAFLLGLGFLVPFYCQHPDYVGSQYASWFWHLRAEDRTQLPIAAMYRDIRLPLRGLGYPLSNPVYLLFQMTSGAALFGLGLLARWRGFDSPRLYRWLFGLVCCWMTVCGSATEASTYCLLAPTLAWGLVEARRGWRGWLTHGLIAAGAALLLFTLMVAWFPHGNVWHVYGLHAIGGTLLTAALLLAEVPGLFRGRSLEPQPATPPLATRQAA